MPIAAKPLRGHKKYIPWEKIKRTMSQNAVVQNERHTGQSKTSAALLENKYNILHIFFLKIWTGQSSPFSNNTIVIPNEDNNDIMKKQIVLNP